MQLQYGLVVVGGTFDHLHKGHEAFLTKAFDVANHVVLCITTDAYVRNFKRGQEGITPFSKRKQAIERWVSKNGYQDRVQILPIDDPYGPTLKREQMIENPLRLEYVRIEASKKQSIEFDAIVVSTETRGGAEEINKVRKANGQKELIIIEIPMTRAEDEERISSTRIRTGEIDENGNFLLPKSLRFELKKPIGTVLNKIQVPAAIETDKGTHIVTVGDMTTATIMGLGMRPALSIIDLHVERQPYLWEKEVFDRLRENARVDYIKSGPGLISSQAMRVIRHWSTTFKGTTLKGVYSNQLDAVIVVDGEEDLLVLPVLLYAPLGTVLYYGQPSQGVVRVVVTEEAKQLAKTLLNKFVRE